MFYQPGVHLGTTVSHITCRGQHLLTVLTHFIQHITIIQKLRCLLSKTPLGTNLNIIRPRAMKLYMTLNAERTDFTILHIIFASNRPATTSLRVSSLYSTLVLTEGLSSCILDMDCLNSSCSCWNDTSWQNNFTSSVKVTISQLSATVVYSYQNGSILGIFDPGPLQPTHYGPSDFFPIFDMAMSNITDDNSTSWYISFVAGQATSGYVGLYDSWFTLISMLTIPVAQFNNPRLSGIYPPGNMKASGSLAVPSYRVFGSVYKANVV